MPPPKIKNIILDLGNTLVHFDYGYFYDGVAHLEKNVSSKQIEKYFTGNNFDLKIGANRINIKQAFKILKKKFNLRIGFADFHYLYCDIFWENTPMKNFLENKLLDSGYRIFMLSNVDSSHINFIDNNFPYVKHVKKRLLSYKVKTIKPEKKIFKHLMEKFSIKPEESIFIDDMKANILTAKNMGFNTILYRSHKKFIQDFNKLTKLPK